MLVRGEWFMKALSELDIKSKKVIIFDLDGTTIDSIGMWNLTDYTMIKRYGGGEVPLEVIQADRDYFLHKQLSLLSGILFVVEVKAFIKFPEPKAKRIIANRSKIFLAALLIFILLLTFIALCICFIDYSLVFSF